MLLVEKWGSKIGLISLDTPENSRLYIRLIFVQDAAASSNINKHSKLTQDACSCLANNRVRQRYGSEECSQ